MYSLVPSNINSSYNIDNTSSNECRIELQWQVCSSINNIYVYIHSIIDVPIQITDMNNTTLRPKVFYRITHNISGNMNTTNISGNEWNTTVQANMTYEFSITPANMFTNGSTTSKCKFAGIHGPVKENVNSNFNLHVLYYKNNQLICIIP